MSKEKKIDFEHSHAPRQTPIILNVAPRILHPGGQMVILLSQRFRHNGEHI